MTNQPDRPATHEPVSFGIIFGLADQMKAALKKAKAKTISRAFLEDFAQTQQQPLTHCYIAANYTNKSFAHTHPVRLTVCVGSCQKWGALESLSHLLDLRTQREGQQQASFDINTINCLDRCQDAPVISIETPDGTAGIPLATPQAIQDALAQLDDA